MDEEHKGEQAPERREEERRPTPPRGRGRGRGQRGRGAPRGRGGAQRALPTAADRAAQLGVSRDAPTKSGPAPPTLSALSKLIDEQYPVTAINETTYQTYQLDPAGYLHLAFSAYREMHMSWRHLHEYLSQHEFLLLCGWSLVRRVILIRSKMGFVSPAESDFLQCMPDIPLPAILAEYLDHVGLIQLPDQTLVYPEIIIPCGINDPQANGLLQGMIPISLSNWDTFDANQIPQMVMYAHLFPFGLLVRAFKKSIGPPANANHFLDRFDPGQANQIDSWLQRPSVLSFDPNILSPPSQQRIAANVFAGLYNSDSFFGAMCFVPEVLANYINVVPMVEKFTHFRIPTASTKGSLAQVAYSTFVPRQNHGYIDSITFHTSVNLSETELHAARTFRFRRKLHDNHCLGLQGEDIDVAITAAPASIRTAAPIRITSIHSPSIYYNYVCSLYMKARIDRAY